MTDKPIGIFDSGIGGLTVLKEVNSRLPGEDLIYFGDTARVPYGTKSKDTVTRFSTQIVEFLLSLNVKMIVVACNSASALALPTLKTAFDIPITGVIQPGAVCAAASTKNRRIGIIGTRATIESGAYEREIRDIASDIEVYSQACPVFVSLVEEGWTDHPATKLIAEEYLAPLKERSIDTLVLGCTHYPLLRELVQEIMGEEVTVIDSGSSCAAATEEVLCDNKLLRDNHPGNTIQYYVSDMPGRFEELGQRFLGKNIQNVTLYKHLESHEIPET